MHRFQGSDEPRRQLIREACRNARLLARICDFLGDEDGSEILEDLDHGDHFALMEDPDERPYIWETEE